MHLKKGLSVAGVGVAVGAAVAIPASAASAGTTYDSTASAVAGYVSVGGTTVPVPDNSVKATDTSGPQSASLGLNTLESALPKSPLNASLDTTFPTGLNLVTESATASSDGTSAACAGFLAGNCSDNKPQPITLSLSLADLPGLKLPNVPAGSSASKSGSSGSGSGSGSGSPGSSPLGLPTSLPTSLPKLGGSSSSSSSASSSGSSSSSPGSSNPLGALAGYKLVLTLSGPEAACTAGPAGSAGSNFTATASLASASVDILQNGKSVLPKGPVTVNVGNILTQLPPLPKQLSSIMGSSTLPASPLDLTINAGSTSGAGSGPVTSATAGELALGVNGTPVLHLIGAKATCGSNNKVAPTGTKTTSHETPLGGGIQTDEGRSGNGPDVAPWAGAGTGAALGLAVTGLTLWRRRRLSA